jgi:hypothetical protein
VKIETSVTRNLRLCYVNERDTTFMDGNIAALNRHFHGMTCNDFLHRQRSVVIRIRIHMHIHASPYITGIFRVGIDMRHPAEDDRDP